MTAKDAQRLSAEHKRAETIAKRLEEEQKLEAQKRNDKWLRTTEVDGFIKKIEFKIEKSPGKNWVQVECDHHNASGRIVCEGAIERLTKEGFQVTMSSENVAAYEGSNDDGFAYAHDAYTSYSLLVKW
jgi:hypothetical protein